MDSQVDELEIELNDPVVCELCCETVEYRDCHYVDNGMTICEDCFNDYEGVEDYADDWYSI